VVSPDGFMSEKIIFADTSECDEEGKGTPVFGTQKVKIRGNVVVEIDAVVQTSTSRRRTVTLTANVPITPVELTNFFELCIPSVFETAFFPRFAEFCNILCETRLATNSITRDIDINPETGEVRIDLIIAICITCEKKIIVPVQLCVLSTGFPELSPEVSPVCTTFPSLFPRQIDENADNDPPRNKPRPRLSLETEDDDEDIEEKEEVPRTKKSLRIDADENEIQTDDTKEDERKPRRRSRKIDDVDTRCPFGHVFGKDYDSFEDCDDCDVWRDCRKENRN